MEVLGPGLEHQLLADPVGAAGAVHERVRHLLVGLPVLLFQHAGDAPSLNCLVLVPPICHAGGLPTCPAPLQPCNTFSVPHQVQYPSLSLVIVPCVSQPATTLTLQERG